MTLDEFCIEFGVTGEKAMDLYEQWEEECRLGLLFECVLIALLHLSDDEFVGSVAKGIFAADRDYPTGVDLLKFSEVRTHESGCIQFFWRGKVVAVKLTPQES